MYQKTIKNGHTTELLYIDGVVGFMNVKEITRGVYSVVRYPATVWTETMSYSIDARGVYTEQEAIRPIIKIKKLYTTTID